MGVPQRDRGRWNLRLERRDVRTDYSYKCVCYEHVFHVSTGC